VRVMIDSPSGATQSQTAAEEPKKTGRPAAPAPPAKRRVKKDESLLEKAKSEPGVKKLLREFGAQVVDIRPLDPPKGSDV